MGREFEPLRGHVNGSQALLYGCSSVGRALVSKTRCREFEPYHPCFLTLSRHDSQNRHLFGALVQLVRISPCHGGGHGFESRTHRRSSCGDNGISRSGAVVARQAHNLEVSGSIPLSATRLENALLSIFFSRK